MISVVLPSEVVALNRQNGNEKAHNADGINRTKKFGQTQAASVDNSERGQVAESGLRWHRGMPTWGIDEPFPNIDYKDSGDVGLVEVRATEHPTGQLLLHEDYDDQEPRLSRNYVLAVVDYDWVVHLIGWLPMSYCVGIWHDFEGAQPGRECKSVYQKQVWKDDWPGLRIVEKGVEYLTSYRGWTASEQLVEFEERAAILEYDGGLSRLEAERQAIRERGVPKA